MKLQHDLEIPYDEVQMYMHIRDYIQAETHMLQRMLTTSGTFEDSERVPLVAVSFGVACFGPLTTFVHSSHYF